MAQDLHRSQSNVPQTLPSETLSRRQAHSLFPQNPEEFFSMSPFQLMRHFSDEMDRMWNGYGRERRGDDSLWRPVVDVREHDGMLQVRADLPGVNDKDVKVSVENDMLVIQGERKREEAREGDGWRRSESSYGSFYRAIPLPEGVEADKANARFQNGVLEIAMPIPKSQQHVRQIPISGGQGTQSGQQSAQEKSSRAGSS